jgi:glyoxylase-like metal-dependent hydrolase (beta-lactamase superfamily II)
MNSYALVCDETGESILIDPGAEPDELAAMLVETRPTAILLTHTHPDHVGALAEMRQRLALPLLAFAGPHFNGLELNEQRELRDGDVIPLGHHSLRVYHAPGHIPDQICLLVQGGAIAIVGDTIFEGGPGKTWSAEAFQTTLDTLRQVVLTWPDETRLYPGHGPDFRLGDRRAAIEAFLEREHGDFFGDAEW